MLLFLFLLFPLGFGVWCRRTGIANFAKHIFLAFTGLFIGAVFCAYKYFFSPFYFRTPDSFTLNFLHVFFGQIFIPLAVLTAAFLFLDKKESLEDRFANILPFYMGFFAVYIPFRVCVSPLPFPFFYLFAKPLMYLAMLLLLPKLEPPVFVKKQNSRLSAKNRAAAYAALALCLVSPAVTEALWTTGVSPLVTAILCMAYWAGTGFILIKK